jgi:sterol desaturase/sphingolipid hydroxylase (fatty acid hydroxylase superfamily)
MYNLSFIPFLAYWICCGLCSLFKDKSHKSSSKNSIINSVESATVFKNVLLLTASTIPANCLVFYFNIISSPVFRWYYILIGIWWVDTIEYFTHYIMHKVPFLYKNFHKEHHKIHSVYSFGALYNSNFEATVTSSMMLYGFYLLGISFPEFICVTTLANIATVLDHSEELTFFNYKRRFHDLHHSKHQNANFQQPFFTYYDKLFGTYKS